MWYLLGSGIKPVSPALAGRCFTRVTREAPAYPPPPPPFWALLIGFEIKTAHTLNSRGPPSHLHYKRVTKEHSPFRVYLLGLAVYWNPQMEGWKPRSWFPSEVVICSWQQNQKVTALGGEGGLSSFTRQTSHWPEWPHPTFRMVHKCLFWVTSSSSLQTKQKMKIWWGRGSLVHSHSSLWAGSGTFCPEWLVMIRSRVGVPSRAAPCMSPLYKPALTAPSSVIADLSGGCVSRSHSSYFADS